MPKITKAAKQAAVLFSDEQLAAVNAGEGYWSVQASPGSGKTSVLVGRVRRLLETENPEDVLSLTFTKEAAKEMRDRAGLEEDTSKRPFGFRTFHSLALAFAVRESRMFDPPLANFPLNLESGPMILEAVKYHRIKSYKDFASWMSTQRRQRISPQKCLASAKTQAEINYAQAYRDYELACWSKGILDFDGLLVAMVNLLENNEEVRARWQYKWVLADEFQDSDPLNVRTLQLLSERHHNVFVVGDPLQSIYQFRGSSPEIFMNLGRYFEGAKTLYLSTNYRSTPQIVDFVKEIAPIKTELVKRFAAFNESGPAVKMTPFPCREDEADAILADVKGVYFIDMWGTMADKHFSGAVLARTNRELRIFQDLFYRAGVRYHLLKGNGFWEQNEIKKVLEFIPRYSSTTPQQAVHMAITDLRLRERAQNFKEIDNSPLENLDELERVAAKYKTVAELLEHARKATAASKGKKGVALGSSHSSKGLQWEFVWCHNVAEGSYPHKNADTIDEEGRLFYVAASRAARRLWVSWSGMPSRFLASVAKPEGAELLLGEKRKESAQ